MNQTSGLCLNTPFFIIVKMKRVFLIDAMSHIYRAFFAPMGMKQEPLRNSKGQVTQAVFVFTNMLRKLLNDERPEYIAAVFDTDVPTFRHDAYDQYKANRQAMPEDLSSQIPLIIRVCEAFKIPIVKMDGFIFRCRQNRYDHIFLFVFLI